MAFPEVPTPSGMFGWLMYILMFCLLAWVVMQIVPALADFIRGLS